MRSKTFPILPILQVVVFVLITLGQEPCDWDWRQEEDGVTTVGWDVRFNEKAIHNDTMC